MKKCASLFLTLVLCMRFPLYAGVQPDSFPDVPDSTAAKVNVKRLALISGLAGSTMLGSYLYVKNTWWKEESRAFHIDSGRDLKYAKNLDKLGHFFGGVVAADLFHNALMWAQMSEKKAYLYGAFFGIFIQTAIEIKDGYAPRWGFSPLDVTMGSLGSFYPMLQRYCKPFAALDIKMSYFIHTNTYFDYTDHGKWNDDYINQTYWLSLKSSHLFSENNTSVWRDFFCLAGGVGIDETTDGRGSGRIEFYVALDYDLTVLTRKSKNRFVKELVRYLNYIKLPAPALRFTPSLRTYALYL